MYSTTTYPILQEYIITNTTEYHPCAIQEFFKHEQQTKPWWLQSQSCNMVCFCPKCTVIC